MAVAVLEIDGDVVGDIVSEVEGVTDIEFEDDGDGVFVFDGEGQPNML